MAGNKKTDHHTNEKDHGMPIARRTPLLDLFPPITPYSTGFLDADDTHKLYWEQSGNPDGVPVVFFHGGPGGGASAVHRRFFDPDHYRIIIFDQRGAGRSHPLGSLENNTLAHLIADIEALRTQLGVEKWHVFGGSWGSTLALSYAHAHKERCISLILRGIFLCEKTEIDWFLYGMKTIFPEAWEQFASFIPDDERDDLLSAYHKRLTNDADKKTQIEAAVRWCLYEGACSSLIPNYDTITTDDQKDHVLALARIEAHYFVNQVIAPEDSLLTKIEHLRSIPTTIIQGRYDIICPIDTANRMHQLWPEAEYVVVADAGHSALDPALRSKLVEATEIAKHIT